MSESETAIVARARAGDRAAFEDLVRRTSRLVFARLYLDCGNATRSEDLVQDTFLAAWKSIGTLKHDAQFRPWLLMIAKNALIDDGRKAAKRKTAALGEVESPARPPGAAAEREETRQKVLAALRTLPEEYQLPLSLKYLAGSDHDTIGTQLGLTNGSLRGFLHRGLKQLREKLKPDV